MDGVLSERQPLFPSPTSPTPSTLSINAITAIASANITTAPVIVRDVLPALPVLPVLPAAVLPAIPVQTGSQLSTTLDSNVVNSNVQGVATFVTIGGATNDVGGSNFMTRYLLPHEKVRKLSKVPTHLRY